MHRPVTDDTRVRAPVVISPAGAHHIHRTLLPGPPAAGTDRLEGMRRGFPFVVLFVGLDGDPEELGLPRHNPMVTDGDCDAFFDGSGGRTSGLFLSFSCAKDPTRTARHPGRSTGETLAYVHPELFAPFHGSGPRHRDPAYLALKADLTALTAELLGQLHRHLPRTRGRVAHHELGTPSPSSTSPAGPAAASTDSPRTSPSSVTAAVPASRTGCVRVPGSGACTSRARTASPAASSARSPAACSPPTKPSTTPAGPACGRDS
ncbi:hypothetical protein [Streptomyces sp. NPDC088915]|uniref:hypothetical protein n=1 Tax=Streptomyces sp. NPDC088915 TaxID=3365912 RepID=UPI00382612E5